MKYENLQKYLDSLLSKGELIFSKSEAMLALGVSDAAFRNSLKRQSASKKVIRLIGGCYLIVPIEFRQLGLVPPELFIDDLMKYLDLEYYVALLSAASFFGATHQAAQNFHVMVRKTIKPIRIGKFSIVFHVNKDLSTTPTQSIKTDRGTLIVSTVEATCLDLIKYFHQSGNFNHIATVLDEMCEGININELLNQLDSSPLLAIQRLGYILEILNLTSVSESLGKYLRKRKPLFYSPLAPQNSKLGSKKNKKWHLIINEEIESDL
tara:strand:+ start:1701 stop:2495 length:795 start_codon:yes stop_codon:yes gene_type:complete